MKKEKWNENVKNIRDNAFEAGQVKGQNDAWKLALKLRYMDYDDKVECFGLEYDGKEKWIEIMEKHTYTEAAAKVEAWEQKEEENCLICQYYERNADQYPCSHCRNCYPCKFKAKLGGE